MTKQDPAKVLELLFEEGFARTYRRRAFVWVSAKGIDGSYYGSYQYIEPADLVGRLYELRLIEGVSLRWLDATHMGIGHSRLIRFPFI